MSNTKFFNDAIAEAKAIRETALANAKLALEEAFTPHLQSMLSAKLEEMDKDDDKMEEEVAEAMDDDKKVDEYGSMKKYGEDDMKKEEKEEDDMPRQSHQTLSANPGGVHRRTTRGTIGRPIAVAAIKRSTQINWHGPCAGNKGGNHSRSD